MQAKRRNAKKTPPKNTWAAKRATRGTEGPVSRDRRIIPVEQGPLRDRAASECQREMARLEKARQEWRAFQEQDEPAFSRWQAATFGPLLSELRELRGKAQTQAQLIADVEMEMMFEGCASMRSAYQSLQRKKAKAEELTRLDKEQGKFWDDDIFSEPPGQEAPPTDDEPRIPTPEEMAAMPEEEQKKWFEEIVFDGMGLDPEFLPRPLYKQMFREFQRSLPGGGKKSAPPKQAAAGGKDAAPEKSRVKELYRVLVRRLHPDLRADSDPQVSALWHEVQVAYQDGNVERLEMLLAFTDVQSGGAGEHTSLSQLHAVIRELKRSFQAVKRSLSEARKSPAWGFARTTDHTQVEARIRKELRHGIATLNEHIAEMEAEITSWTAPRSKRSGRRKPPF